MFLPLVLLLSYYSVQVESLVSVLGTVVLWSFLVHRIQSLLSNLVPLIIGKVSCVFLRRRTRTLGLVSMYLGFVIEFVDQVNSTVIRHLPVVVVE